MPKRRFAKSTLERRGRFFFGLFILLTVVACLWWPWWQMERLVRAADPDRAQALVMADLRYRHTHTLKQMPEEDLKQLKQIGAGKEVNELKLRRLPPAEPGQAQAVPTGCTPFEEEAVRLFLKHPEESRTFRTQGDAFQYVQALRAESTCIACHSETAVKYKPGELMGLVNVELSVKERNKTLLANRVVLVAAALLVVVVSVAVFYALFRYMVVRPIQHLKDVADRVSEGDLMVRSEIDTGNELETLSDAMNHMLDATAQAQAELKAATEARDAKLDELAKANVALFEMNQVKTKFLTTMSHELRTPLNSILGFAQIVSDAPAVAGDPKLSRYADNIVSSGRMLLEMINDLLDLAKIEAGRLQVRCEKVSPPDIAEAVCNMVRPLLAEAPIALAYTVDPATPLMLTDATKVRQILYNLLSNAIKFTAEGEVRLDVRPVEDAHVAFAVSDTGVGIPRDEHLRIFERFTQLDSSHTRRYRGTGLGLSIVKELTGLLGGTVSVESEVGRGSTFTVVLPVDSSAAEGRSPENGAAPAKPADGPVGQAEPA
jgi:two-component system, NarL family, sensor histidine kinase BarA